LVLHHHRGGLQGQAVGIVKGRAMLHSFGLAWRLGTRRGVLLGSDGFLLGCRLCVRRQCTRAEQSPSQQHHEQIFHGEAHPLIVRL
jgi:hypothetical protein